MAADKRGDADDRDGNTDKRGDTVAADTRGDTDNRDEDTDKRNDIDDQREPVQPTSEVQTK